MASVGRWGAVVRAFRTAFTRESKGGSESSNSGHSPDYTTNKKAEELEFACFMDVDRRVHHGLRNPLEDHFVDVNADDFGADDTDNRGAKDKEARVEYLAWIRHG